jgi:hypothetical protein
MQPEKSFFNKEKKNRRHSPDLDPPPKNIKNLVDPDKTG